MKSRGDHAQHHVFLSLREILGNREQPGRHASNTLILIPGSNTRRGSTMADKDHQLSDDLPNLITSARRDRDRRTVSYRSRALKLFPPVCARCGRDFAGKKIRELTVHHKDHNHDNNPPDGSNWEMLCLYCHENEHARKAAADDGSEGDAASPATYQPFAGLDKLLKKSR